MSTPACSHSTDPLLWRRMALHRSHCEAVLQNALLANGRANSFPFALLGTSLCSSSAPADAKKGAPS